MDLECPYCAASLSVCHDDGAGYEEGVKHRMTCGYCGKTFVFETFISFNYEPEKADCLNGADHKWYPTCTSPREFTNIVCDMCGDTRPPEPSEKEIVNSSTSYQDMLDRFDVLFSRT